MRLIRHRLRVETRDPVAFVDLTDDLRAWVRGTGIRDGLLTVSVLHTTARLAINEREPRLQGDMRAFLERLAPRGKGYAHDLDTVDGRPNAHAHLLALLLNTTETVPVADGDLDLGGWQWVFLVELDGPRPAREVGLHLLGE